MISRLGASYTDWAKKEWCIIILYTLISLQFYAYVGFSNTMIKLPLFLTVPLMLAYCWNTFIKNVPNRLFLLMRWLVLFNIMAILCAFVFWRQSIVLGYRAMAVEFTLLFYFYLMQRKPSIQSLEKYVFIFGVLYIVLWIYAMNQFPVPVFGFNEDGEVKEDLSRGILRINFGRKMFLVLAYFIALNRGYVLRKKIWFAIASIFFIVIVLQVTRQLILWTGLVTIIYVFQKNKKLLVIGVVFFMILFALGRTVKFSPDSIVGTMINLTEEQIESNKADDENIRITEYRYFFTQWSRNIVADIIGNGFPHGDSLYGRYNTNLEERQELYLSDVGYGRMKVVTGIAGMIVYLALFVRCCLIRMPSHLAWTKMFMLLFALLNLASAPYSTADGQITMCICVYLMTIYALPKMNKKRFNILKSK